MTDAQLDAILRATVVAAARKARVIAAALAAFDAKQKGEK